LRAESTSRTSYELNGKSFPVEGTPDYNNLSGKRINSNTTRFTLIAGSDPFTSGGGAPLERLVIEEA
jgi:hypothetical protein